MNIKGFFNLVTTGGEVGGVATSYGAALAGNDDLVMKANNVENVSSLLHDVAQAKNLGEAARAGGGEVVDTIATSLGKKMGLNNGMALLLGDAAEALFDKVVHASEVKDMPRSAMNTPRKQQPPALDRVV